MSEVKGATADTLQHAGEYGNACVARLKHTFAAVQIGDIVKFGELPGGSEIYGVKIHNAALGATTTLDVGIRYLTASDGTSDDDAFTPTPIDTATAGETLHAGAPVEIANGDGVEIIGTVAGAAATGLVHVTVEYEYKGQ